MAETSKGRVTITLGRGGQVVKRAATVSDVDYSDSRAGVGSKRSVRDRLGSNFGSTLVHESEASNKRQRGDGSLTTLNANSARDLGIGKNDLRFKLMQKNVFRRVQSDDHQKTVDLRERLSRTEQPLRPSLGSLDMQQRIPEPKASSGLGRIPPTRSADNLPQMDSSRISYSAWSLDHIRRRSPDRFIGTSRGLSPPRYGEERPRRPLNRTFDDVRTVAYVNKDVIDTPRSVSSSTTFLSKPALPPAPTKPVTPFVGQVPPTSGVVQRSSYAVQGEEQQTVEGLLHSLGLGKYAILFKAEEVDMTALKQMGERDLKELGIPMGPRKKILLALLPLSKRQP